MGNHDVKSDLLVTLEVGVIFTATAIAVAIGILVAFWFDDVSHCMDHHRFRYCVESSFTEDE